MGKNIIDCDATPFIPEGWEIRPEDQLPGAVGGQLEFDPAKIAFHLVDGQVDESVCEIEIMQKLSSLPLLKANVADSLMADPGLIPEEWISDGHGRIRHILFWGTIFRDSEGSKHVLCLHYHDGKWGSYDRLLLDEDDPQYYWLHAEFNVQDQAAVLAD